jgi:hypothetical protein
MKPATFSLLLTTSLMLQSCLSGVGSSPHSTQTSRMGAHIYGTGPPGFPEVQPPACMPPDTCKPISAAPPCCSRGRGASGVHGTALPLGSSETGGKPASKAATAPLKRRRYTRYRGATHVKARDQELRGGCLMREALIGWDIVATLMCPVHSIKASCLHLDCDGQVGHECNSAFFVVLHKHVSVNASQHRFMCMNSAETSCCLCRLFSTRS